MTDIFDLRCAVDSERDHFVATDIRRGSDDAGYDADLVEATALDLDYFVEQLAMRFPEAEPSLREMIAETIGPHLGLKADATSLLLAGANYRHAKLTERRAA